MRALLDTHAIIWAVENDARLGDGAIELISNCQAGDLGISDMSLLEIAMLSYKNRIPLKGPIAQILNRVESLFEVLKINATAASKAYELPLAQSDPFDRIIAATARHYQVPLITKDRHITESGCVETIW